MGLGGSGLSFPNRKCAERLKLSVSVARVENQLQSKKKKKNHHKLSKIRIVPIFMGMCFHLKAS